MSNPTTFPSPLTLIGKAVTGTYQGEAFTGTVTDARYHTLNHRVVVIFVDTPGFVYGGMARDGICVEVSAATGGHEPTYGYDYGDSIAVA